MFFSLLADLPPPPPERIFLGGAPYVAVFAGIVLAAIALVVTLFWLMNLGKPNSGRENSVRKED